MGDSRHDSRGSVYVWVSWDENMKRQGVSFIRCRGEVYIGNSKHYDFLVFCGKGVIVDLHLYDYPI